MENLEKSELVIAKILGLLLEWGLSDSELRFDELGLDNDFQQFFAPCVEWLEAEGVIRVTETHRFLDGETLVVNPIITAHGLAMLGKQINVGDKQTTIATAVKKTTKDTNFYTGIGDLGGGFVGGLLKSLGNG
ncbi:MAG: hypothetical protein ACRC14_13505 [Paracoccaceae bacterium]